MKVKDFMMKKKRKYLSDKWDKEKAAYLSDWAEAWLVKNRTFYIEYDKYE